MLEYPFQALYSISDATVLNMADLRRKDAVEGLS